MLADFAKNKKMENFKKSWLYFESESLRSDIRSNLGIQAPDMLDVLASL